MAQNHIELIGCVLLLVFAGTMFYQGAMILRGHRGYTHRNYMNMESENIRKRVEELLKDK